MLKIEENISLAPLTSWQIGGRADFLALPQSLDELQQALIWGKDSGHAVSVLGGGSNVLISDQGIEGLTIALKKFSGIEIISEGGESHRLQLSVLAGTSKSDLLKIFLKYKLAPALFLAGIPGDTGGGVVMNAGVAEAIAPREFVEIVDWVEVLKPDLSLVKYTKAELDWSYRHSFGWEPGIIVRVGLSWALEPQPDILQKVRDANRLRLQKQPLDMPSCGSVFMNPPGHKAAQLIDQCGLKGYCLGAAMVSPKHANFIVNVGSAAAADVWAVIGHVQSEVLKRTGVSLSTEVRRLGRW